MSSERFLHIGASVALVLALSFLGAHLKSCVRASPADSGARSVATEAPQPHHVTLLCPMHAADVECPAKERASAADVWLKEAVHHPSSSFCIRTVGDRRDDVKSFFCACVPEVWGANVLAAKRAFMQETRRRAGQALDTPPPPLGCDARSDPAAQESQVVVLGPLMPPALRRLANALSQASANESDPPLHGAIICDMSPAHSGLPSCRPETALIAFDALAAGGALVGGSTLNLYLVNAGQAPPRSMFHLSIESTMPRSQRVALVLAARSELPTVLRTVPPDNASAIAEAFSAVVFELRQRPGRYATIFLSDFREYNGTFNFERTVPQPAAFADYLRAKGLWTDAKGVVVRGCGLHNQGGGPLGKAVNDLWVDLLRQQGATDTSFFSSCNVSDLAVRVQG